MKTRTPSPARKLVLAALFLALAFVLPLLTGQVPQVGSMLCPMHFPVLLCGFVLGGPWGLAVGFAAPLLRSVLFTDARCDMLILQSPWIPLLHDHAAEVVQAIRQKQIRLAILCGSEDEDCLPLARHLHAAAAQAGLDETLHIQKGTRHQFPAKPYALADLL